MFFSNNFQILASEWTHTFLVSPTVAAFSYLHERTTTRITVLLFNNPAYGLWDTVYVFVNSTHNKYIL